MLKFMRRTSLPANTRGCFSNPSPTSSLPVTFAKVLSLCRTSKAKMTYSPPRKKIRMSDNIDTKLTDLDQSSRKSKSPAIAKDRYLSFFRGLCDLCLEPPSPDDNGEIICGSSITFLNADKLDFARDSAKSALEFYNCTKLTNFKLVKVCKANFGGLHIGLTFRAHEDESEECSLFRGAVKCVIGSGVKAVFCEIKGNDEVTLLPGDDDYISKD